MGHIPEDENFDEFMNASAEEWSKPEKAPSAPEPPVEKTDRWGSPIPEENVVSATRRSGSEPIASQAPNNALPVKKKGLQWWVIVIIVVVLLCLCACIALVGLPAFGINLIENFSY